jgi:hypothetical protein
MRTHSTQIARVAVYALRRFDRRRFKVAFTAWFEPASCSMAVLVQTPADGGADIHVGWTPLTQQPQDNTRREAGPQETWWALEDLWTRLSMRTALTIERDGDTSRLVLPAFRYARGGALAELRNAVFDTGTYTWRSEGMRGEFVSLIDYRGDDLVCTLTRPRRIEAWPDGEELVWQVKSFLLRLERSVASRRYA